MAEAISRGQWLHRYRLALASKRKDAGTDRSDEYMAGYAAGLNDAVRDLVTMGKLRIIDRLEKANAC